MSTIEPAETASLVRRHRPALLPRAAALALGLLLEKYFLNLFVDLPRADAAQGFGAIVRFVWHCGFSFAITLALSLAVFILVERKHALHEVNEEARTVPLSSRWLGLHLALLGALAASLTLWFRSNAELPLPALVTGSLALAAAAIFALVVGLAPLTLWCRAAAALGWRWLYSGAIGAAAVLAQSWSQELWSSAANTTFFLVRLCLQPFLPSLYTDPAARILATDHFAIQVFPYCSGLEGVGLMLAFSAAWLLYFRREYIFPRALLLIPAGVAVIFGLNVLRIAALLLIGHAGYPAIAIYGFHSQAGWIAFNAAACGLAFVSRESVWLNRAAREKSGPTENPTAAYLMPLVALLAAGTIAHALSGGFETWYGLRLLAGGTALALCWRRLGTLDWRFGWKGLVAGAAVFVFWIAAAHVSIRAGGMPLALARMPAAERILWVTIRAGTAILVVPIIEEVAYRGYLLRRLVAADFEAVPWTSPGWAALALSAVLFGAAHGILWWPAVGAGMVYGLLLTRTGRIGEAVAAHAVTNALLALAVLGFGQWQLWA